MYLCGIPGYKIKLFKSSIKKMIFRENLGELQGFYEFSAYFRRENEN